jgi:hypothetical protein
MPCLGSASATPTTSDRTRRSCDSMPSRMRRMCSSLDVARASTRRRLRSKVSTHTQAAFPSNDACKVVHRITTNTRPHFIPANQNDNRFNTHIIDVTPTVTRTQNRT